MSKTDFPAHIRAALDQYEVPPLPAGFADRLLAKVDANTLPPLPVARPQLALGGRWRRSGVIAGSLGLFGMVTAAAAATGFFGEAVYVPVVSEALAKANIAPLPKAAKESPAKLKAKPKAAPIKIEAKAEQSVAEQPDGESKAKLVIRALWQDPVFRQLPKEERRIAAKQRLHAGFETGEYSKEELKAAMQQMQAERAEKREQRAAARSAFGLPEKPHGGPSKKALAALKQREVVERLREQLTNASPEERKRIHAELRVLREARRAARMAAEAAKQPPKEPNMVEDVAEPPK